MLGGVLDEKFELTRTIHIGIVAVAKLYNFRIPTLDKASVACKVKDPEQNVIRVSPV